MPGLRKGSYLATFGVFLTTTALIVGTAGCGCNSPPSQNLEIRTWYDLDAIRDNLAGNHTLMNDLDSTTPGYTELASPTANGGKGWQPIVFPTPYGTRAYEGFMGAFDGQGHKIRDLYINRPDERWAGLFGCTEPEGVIQDVGVMNATVIGDEYVGGLLAVTNGPVSNCYCSGKVTGNKDVGGLVGVNSHGAVYSSYFTGSVIGVDSVGGLVGRNNGTVSNSYSTGNVTGDKLVGGLVGENDDPVSNCYSAGTVSGKDSAGGLVGYDGGPVSNSFWDIETSGQSSSPGGTGQATAQMKNVATFSGVTWNITAVANLSTRNLSYVWNIVDGVTYPFLSWEPVF